MVNIYCFVSIYDKYSAMGMSAPDNGDDGDQRWVAPKDSGRDWQRIAPEGSDGDRRQIAKAEGLRILTRVIR